jgi:hypothetical protein
MVQPEMFSGLVMKNRPGKPGYRLDPFSPAGITFQFQIQ